MLVGSQLEVVQTQVCRDQEEVLTTGEMWKRVMVEKRGWPRVSLDLQNTA